MEYPVEEAHPAVCSNPLGLSCSLFAVAWFYSGSVGVPVELGFSEFAEFLALLFPACSAGPTKTLSPLYFPSISKASPAS